MFLYNKQGRLVRVAFCVNDFIDKYIQHDKKCIERILVLSE